MSGFVSTIKLCNPPTMAAMYWGRRMIEMPLNATGAIIIGRVTNKSSTSLDGLDVM